ncbi:MAG TPA: hypothetical protein VLR91_09820 [Thermodesulfobacteriota bacterium]|nr:hypothetical protein [Thermodesulfobacteriota bacterium]
MEEKEVEKDRAVIRAVPDVRNSLKGLLKGKPSMGEALIAEHREEVRKGRRVTCLMPFPCNVGFKKNRAGR